MASNLSTIRAIGLDAVAGSGTTTLGWPAEAAEAEAEVRLPGPRGYADHRRAPAPPQDVRRTIEFDPASPCNYYLAGYCRFGSSCAMCHDVPYAEAIEAQWLEPADAAAARRLAERALAASRPLERRSLAHELGPAPSARGSSAASSRARWAGDAGASEGRCPFDVLAVLDLEGKEEITEFPVLLLDVASRRELGRFHRWVRPVRLFDGCGPLSEGTPAVPFKQVLTEFDEWMRSRGLQLWPDRNGGGHRLAFVTCGHWDLRSQVPKQCGISGVAVPPAMQSWINIKDSFNGHHGTHITGMKGALARMGLLDDCGAPKHGFHHLGMHDVENIARITLHLLDDGATVDITGCSSY